MSKRDSVYGMTEERLKEQIEEENREAKYRRSTGEKYAHEAMHENINRYLDALDEVREG